MALTIASNVSSLTAQNNLTKSNSNLKTSLERLSSGFKINRGADGPAALVISEKQRAQIAGLETAIQNSEKAVSLVQTAEGALNEINNLLIKVRSLALDSANEGVNDLDALNANQAEIDNALDTINRISDNTQFTTKKLLNGDSGIKGTPTVAADITFLQATSDTSPGTHTLNVTTAGERAHTTSGAQTGALTADETLTINGVTVELFTGMSRQQVEDRINQFTAQTGVVAQAGSTANTTQLYSTSFGSAATIEVISNTAGSATSSNFGTTARTDAGVDVVLTIDAIAYTGQGNVVTVDGGVAKGLSVAISEDSGDATSTTSGTGVGSITISDNSLVFQIGANQNQTSKIAVSKAHSGSLGLGVVANRFNNLSEIDITNESKAQDAIAVIDAAIDDVTNMRGTLGAFQSNTLEATANNLRTTLENSVNAQSVIRDTDFAAEIAEFTKQQVLMQAGTSVLGNANQIPQLVLGLLG